MPLSWNEIKTRASAVEYKQFDPVNREAAENMGRLHDRLKVIG
jgi:hypothetical protein